MPVPLDEYPIHQAPVSMAHFDTSDRNVYDRCIMHAFARDGAEELITGLGVYPHLGVIDAYAVLRRGTTQVAVRASDALGDDRLRQEVGPFRLEIIEPLQSLRVVCDAAELGLACDLTWQGAFPAADEPRQTWRQGRTTLLDASRFVQVGAWTGSIHVDGEELVVDDATWSGTRDRSWGIRPVGEAVPPGRPLDEGDLGFWWVWAPLRFDDFAVVVIAQEDSEGTRLLTEALRIWPRDSGRPPEQLGWPEIDIRYSSGTRDPIGATIHVTDRATRSPFEIEVETLGGLALHVGAGYGGDPDWSHGRWMGEGWVEAARYDLTDPAVAGRLPFGITDHVARATCDGAVGSGIFEHMSLGRHDPSGFTDLGSVAP